MGRSTKTSANGIQSKILYANNIHDTSQNCQELRNTLNEQKKSQFSRFNCTFSSISLHEDNCNSNLDLPRDCQSKTSVDIGYN